MDSNRKVKAYIEVRFNTDKEILLQAVDLSVQHRYDSMNLDDFQTELESTLECLKEKDLTSKVWFETFIPHLITLKEMLRQMNQPNKKPS